MSKINRYLASLSIILPLASCSGFLEPKSENEFVPTSVQDIDEMLLYETYNNARSIATIPFFDLLSDDVAVVRFQSTENNLLTQVHLASIKALYTWQPDAYKTLEEDRVSDEVYDIYAGCYARILGCNAALDYIGKVSGTEEEKSRVMAEAHALRAFYYFHLVNCYGHPYNADPESPGVPLHLESKVSSVSIPRNTVSEVYEQVLKDLLEAESLYENVQEEDRWKSNMRVSLPFVQLLLSRVYLYMEDWEKASGYASKVIGNGNFRLKEIAEFPQDGSYPYYHTYTNPEVIWPYGNAAEFRDFVDPYMINIALGGKVSFVIASPDLVNKFSAGDVRLSAYFIRDPRSSAFKAYGKQAVTGNSNDPDANYKFARSFRISEAYLNMAEAEAMLFKLGKGDTHRQEAVRLLTLLRSKRISGSSETDIDQRTPDMLVRSVRDERRRELCFEDHRWFDLRRQGMPAIAHEWKGDNSDANVSRYTLKQNDPMYTLQIPKEVMLKNSLLEQNEGGPARVD